MLESFFIFNGRLYKQCDGAEMGSFLGPRLANVFMYHFQNNWLENSLPHVKPIVYRKFLDDIFLLFQSKDHVQKLKNYLDKQHKNKIYVANITI